MKVIIFVNTEGKIEYSVECDHLTQAAKKAIEAVAYIDDKIKTVPKTKVD